MRPLILAAITIVLLPLSGGPGGAMTSRHVPGALLAKVNELKIACGARVVSAHRAGARTPSGHLSEHALGRAVDVQGNPSCIYARLRNWPGGYSTDYWSAPGGPHVHISYGPGGREWGQRFSHRGGRSVSASRKTRGGYPTARRGRNDFQGPPHWVPGAL